MPAAQLIPVGAGALAALLHLSVTAGSSGAFMLAYFAQLPIAATGLGLGLMPAAVAAAVASVIVALASPGSGALTLFLLITALPVLLVVYFVLRQRPVEDGTTVWYPVGRILGWLTGLGLAGIAVALVVFAGSEGGLQGAVERYLQSFLQVFQTEQSSAVDTAIRSMSRIFPGAAATSWILMTSINCVLAQHLLSLSGRNIRPKPPYRQLEVVLWPLPVAALAAAATFSGGFPGFVGINVLIVALVPFFFIGMAVLHSISAAWPGRPLLLAGVYVFLVLLLWPAAFVALLGIAENWIRLRDRFAASRTKKGND